MTAPTSDFIGLLTLITAWALGPEVAVVVGPYVGIFVAASIGASFSVASRVRATRLLAAGVFMRLIILAMMATVTVTHVVQGYYPDLPESWLLLAVALTIGFVGERWGQIFDRVLGAGLRFLDNTPRKGQP